MRDINIQKQIWTDKEFKRKLEEIKARRLLNGKPINSITQLTKEIINCPSWKQLEKELINFDRKILEIKTDKKRGLL